MANRPKSNQSSSAGLYKIRSVPKEAKQEYAYAVLSEGIAYLYGAFSEGTAVRRPAGQHGLAGGYRRNPAVFIYGDYFRVTAYPGK